MEPQAKRRAGGSSAPTVQAFAMEGQLPRLAASVDQSLLLGIEAPTATVCDMARGQDVEDVAAADVWVKSEAPAGLREHSALRMGVGPAGVLLLLFRTVEVGHGGPGGYTEVTRGE